MILEEDSLLNLTYDAATDILTIRWPDLIDTPLPEIENSLQKLSRSVANYDVKKLLLDLTSGQVRVDEKSYRELILQFMVSLTATRLQKMARVIPENPVWESQLQQYSKEIKSKLTLPFQARSFARLTDALSWLQHQE